MIFHPSYVAIIIQSAPFVRNAKRKKYACTGCSILDQRWGERERSQGRRFGSSFRHGGTGGRALALGSSAIGLALGVVPAGASTMWKPPPDELLEEGLAFGTN